MMKTMILIPGIVTLIAVRKGTAARFL